MPSLRLKYMVDDYWEFTEEGHLSIPSLKPEYLIPDYKELETFNPDQLSLHPSLENKLTDTAA